jgi:hypothetical protein
MKEEGGGVRDAVGRCGVGGVNKYKFYIGLR